MSEEKAIQKQTKGPTVLDRLGEKSEQFEQALSGYMETDKFMSICTSCFVANPKLRDVPWQSFVLACMEAAQLGLTPGSVLGDCYIVPRWNKNMGQKWATFLIGYRGMMKLIRRSGNVVEIAPELVRENDEFHESLGTKRGLHHIPWYCVGEDEGGAVTHAYSTVTLDSGKVLFNVIYRDEIDKAARMSGNPRDESMSNVWRDHWDAMALKTGIRRHAKFLSMPDEVKEAIVRDEYRAFGEDEAAMTVEQRETERELMLADPGLKLRKAHASAMDKAWRRGIKFCSAAGVEFDRQNIGPFHRLVMWLSSDGDPWPNDKAEQLECLETAVKHLDKWLASDDGEALCAEFSHFIHGEAAAEAFGDDAPAWSDPAKDDAAFEAAQGGE